MRQDCSKFALVLCDLRTWVFAGAAIGVVKILTLIIYGRRVDVTGGNPLVVGGALIVTTGIGWLFLREMLNPWQVLAVFSIIVSVIMLAWQAGRGL